MNYLACLIFAVATAMIASTPGSAFAQEPAPAPAQASDEAMQINQGDWEVGGGASYSRVSGATGGWILNLSPQAEYFFLNRFSAGARLSYIDTDTVDPSTAIGPSLTYYFMVTDNMAYFVDQTVQYVNPAGSGNYYMSGETGIGADWFLSPNVAFGPAVRNVYYFSGDNRPEGAWRLDLALSIFL